MPLRMFHLPVWKRLDPKKQQKLWTHFFDNLHTKSLNPQRCSICPALLVFGGLGPHHSSEAMQHQNMQPVVQTHTTRFKE